MNSSTRRALRRRLHICLRSPHQIRVLSRRSRVTDVTFVGSGIAAFVPSYFWHGGSERASWPRQSAAFWHAKIEANMAGDSNEHLRAERWNVVFPWALERAAAKVATVFEQRRENLHV